MKHSTKTISGVNVDIENAVAEHGKTSAAKLKEIYFNHLSDEEAQAGADALYAELQGKKPKDTAAHVIEYDETGQPITIQ